MNEKINVKATKVGTRKKIVKIVKIILLIIVFILLVLYLVMGVIYNSGNFSITLDKNLYFDKGIIIYDDPDYKVYRSELFAETIPTFDNISGKWIPEDVWAGNGSNNGKNYMAYSFYMENEGKDPANIWAEVIIDDVIKNLDEAVRVRVYKDGEYNTYAKLGANGEAEPETESFYNDKYIMLEEVKDFKPGDIIKYTVVVWLEGADPECTDNILGGEIKFHMNFNSEFVEEEK